jgi:hypothetical protein
MIGLDGTSSWTDTNTVSAVQRYYKVGRVTSTTDTDGDGLSDFFEFSVSGNITNVDPLADADGDGYSNWDEALMGTSPNDTNDPVTVYVDASNIDTNTVADGSQAHPFRNIQGAMQCSVSVNSNLAIRVRPGNYYETVSNLHYDFSTGGILSNRKFAYLYAANTDWSLSIDPETHIIDSSGLPNGDVLGNTNANVAPAVEFYNVTRARINGFTIRGGAGPYGGGIEASSLSGPVYISNCIIERNSPQGNSEAGGIFLQASTNSLIYNCVIAKNSGAAGAIVDVYGARIWNCTVVNNVNSQDGVGAVAGIDGPPNVRNCIVWGNGIDLYFADADYSTFQSNVFTTVGPHNLTNDPILVSADFGNYRLQTNSPMFGAGTSLAIERRDLYGNSRPASTGIDIGANEFEDSDSDGMQDDWETKHGLNPNSAGDATTNLDSDAFNNLAEYNHNTDPRNSDTDGDDLSDSSDPDPTTPDVRTVTAFLDSLKTYVWEMYIDGAHDPQWINLPPSAPKVVVLNNKHVGDVMGLQFLLVSSVGGGTVDFLVPEAKGDVSPVKTRCWIPLPNETPVGQAGTPGVLVPPEKWKSTLTEMTLTNTAGPCGGFDDETLQFFPATLPALSVPQGGTNTFTTIIDPTNVVSQIIFRTDNPSLATASPSPAQTAAQLVSVAGLATGNAIASTVLLVKGVGAQNSVTVTCSQVAIDILPKRTNVTVAVYRIIASAGPSVAPTNVPTQAQLKSYLDGLYGKQANVFMNVLPLVSTNVNYDLNTNGVMDIVGNRLSISPEMQAITGAVYMAGALNVYYVRQFSTTDGGLSSVLNKASFVQDFHTGTNVYTTAHELGHQLGLPGVCTLCGPPSVPGNTDRLMYEFALSSNPCRLIRSEWTNVNDSAKP